MSKFIPGQSKPKGSGRKKGSPNKRSMILDEELIKFGLNVPQKIAELIPKLPIEKQLDALLDLMNYIYPKRKSLEHEKLQNVPDQLQVTFIGSQKKA